MTQQANAHVRGEVSYREGDGMPQPIPNGPVEIEFAQDSVAIGWNDGEGGRGSAAMPHDEFERHVKEGRVHIRDEA